MGNNHLAAFIRPQVGLWNLEFEFYRTDNASTFETANAYASNEPTKGTIRSSKGLESLV